MPVTSLEEVAGNWSRDLGGDRSSGRLPCPVQGLSSSPSSHTGIVSDVPGRLSSGSSLAARGRGDACQRSLRNRPRSGSRLLQSSLPGGEGDWRLEACDRSLSFERLRPADAVQDGNSRFGAVVCQRGDFLASLDLKDAYFQIPIHGSSRKLLRFMSEGQFTSSKPCASVCRLLPRSLPESSRRCRLGLTLAGFDCSVTWTIGWSSPPRRRRPWSRSGSSSRFVAPSGL